MQYSDDNKVRSKILKLLALHEGLRSRCINLVVSENIVSYSVRALLASDLMHRYSLRLSNGSNFYTGTKHIDSIVEYANSLAKTIFDADYANTEPISGHACSLAVLMNLTKINDSIMVLSKDDGGYPGYTEGYLPSRLGLKVHYIPFDKSSMRIDVNACIDKIIKVKPRLVVIGQSIITFYTELSMIADACKDINAMLVYDASHTLGLIAGKVLKNPLHDGAQILIASTHKSLPGPQGGLILADRDDGYGFDEYLRLRVIDNPHFNRITALALALEEFSIFGEQYARQVVSNAKALAKALDEEGLDILCKDNGYTETHQVLIKDFAGKDRFVNMLEQVNIIVDRGLRLGVCEVTRRGMKEKEMRYIAELIAEVYNYNNDKSIEDNKINKLKDEVSSFISQYQSIHYSLDNVIAGLSI